MRKIFHLLAESLLAIQRWILFICCVLVIIGLFAQVILRYVLGTTILGLNELILIPTVWMYFVGASYASAEDTHISADILQVYLRSQKLKQVIQVVVLAISLTVGFIFSWWACLYIQHSLDRPGATPVFSIPLIVVQSAVIVGFFLMTIYTATHCYTLIKKLNSETEVKPSDSSKSVRSYITEG